MLIRALDDIRTEKNIDSRKNDEATSQTDIHALNNLDVWMISLLKNLKIL